MGKELALGSPEWVDWVFGTDPVRAAGNYNQRWAPRFEPGKPTWLEGGEAVIAYLIDWHKRLGVVLRWKPQAFTWLPDRALAPRIPDFLVELADRRLLIVQGKSRKYMTQQVLDDFQAEADTALRADMLHRVWTEGDPITPAVRTNAMLLRGARNTPHEPQQLELLVTSFRDRSQATLSQLIGEGREPALVLLAVSRGALHFDYTKTIDETTRFASTPVIDGRSFLLERGFDAQGWWHSLPARQ